MSKPSDLGSLKIGSYILLPHSDQPSGEPCRIVEYDTSKPGKHGAAKARIVAEGIFD
ncbi:MAG: translation initiation factor IF-5A, partial [Candidatus Nitrosomaritimum yanchengensis]